MISSNEHRQRPPVVVVGLDCITGLQTARVFARRDVEVVGIASDPRHFGCRTRACAQIIIADTGSEVLIHCLRDLGLNYVQKPVLVPCTDNSVLQISRYRERLCDWYRMALPTADVVEILTDKTRFPGFAEKHGLPVPKAFTLTSLAEAHQIATVVTYPAVMKPPVKTAQWRARDDEIGRQRPSTRNIRSRLIRRPHNRIARRTLPRALRKQSCKEWR